MVIEYQIFPEVVDLNRLDEMIKNTLIIRRKISAQPFRINVPGAFYEVREVPREEKVLVQRTPAVGGYNPNIPNTFQDGDLDAVFNNVILTLRRDGYPDTHLVCDRGKDGDIYYSGYVRLVKNNGGTSQPFPTPSGHILQRA